jgi:hypothetical protein
MDNLEKGALLVEKGDLEKKVINLKQKLTDKALVFQKLAQALLTNPDTVVFANIPKHLPLRPPDLAFESSFDWNIISGPDDLAQLIHDLRQSNRRLIEIEVKLRP